MITHSKINQLIFDADDTLWQNNIYYLKAAEDFIGLATSVGLLKENIEQEFQTLERKVVKEMGYGSKNYLYILQTLYKRYNLGSRNTQIITKFENICSEFTKHLHISPRIFPNVTSILSKLANKYPLYVLTKGNIKEQHLKLSNSGLLKYFQRAFVEPEKDISTYRRILIENKWIADETCMIGNSPKSDINPALQTGMFAILIPYQHTWIFEEEPLLSNQDRLKIIQSFSDLPKLFIEDL